MIKIIFHPNSVNVHVVCPANDNEELLMAIIDQMNITKEELKEAIRAASQAEREEILADFERKLQEELGKLGYTEADKDEIVGIIREVYTPSSGETLKGVRFERKFSAKGLDPEFGELITESRIYHDTPRTTAEIQSSLVIMAFISALDAAIAIEANKGPKIDISVSGLTNREETIGKSWTSVSLEAVLLAEIAANEGERGILQSSLDDIRAEVPV